MSCGRALFLSVRDLWIGTNPGNVDATNWKTFVLTSASEFRSRHRLHSIRRNDCRNCRGEEFSSDFQHE